MELSCQIGGQRFAVEAREPVEIGISVKPTTPSSEKDGSKFSSDSVSAFHIPPATAAPLTFGSWVGAVSHGASVNCPVLTACFHGVGTHTECCGHALAKPVCLHREVPIKRTLIPAVLLTVDPVAYEDASSKEGEGGYMAAKGDDRVVSKGAAEASLERLGAAQGLELLKEALKDGGALVIRTTPNPAEKRCADYGGSNPVYLLPQFCAWAVSLGVQHLLIDLPSADREDDGGHLLSHRAFWELPPKGADESGARISPRTITELCYCPDEAADGLYLLDLQVSPIEMDAAPSRPLLYRLKPSPAS